MRSVALKRIGLPLVAGLLGSSLLTGVYFALVSLAESPQHALDQFQADAWYVGPILLGFGLQAALFTILRWGLFAQRADHGASGALTGAGGGTSAVAMAACCAHHVTDVLPILGLTAATAFLAEYRELFMMVGLLTTIGGSIYMLRVLRRALRPAEAQPLESAA